jgi:predicted phosphodiesterase
MFYLKIVALPPQRIQVFGDLHGTEKWQTLLDTSVDKIIFLGDYVDSHGERISDKQIVNNLCDLLLLKIDYADKVVLLWGNHDVAYFQPDVFSCSGSRIYCSYGTAIHELLETNQELFQAAYQQKNFLFTHAGLTRRFWRETLRAAGDNYAAALNRAFLKNCSLFNLASHYRGGGGDYGSIFWADKREFIDENTDLPKLENWLSGLIQVVGHQPVKRITSYKEQDSNSEMIWLDTWSYPGSSADAALELEI